MNGQTDNQTDKQLVTMDGEWQTRNGRKVRILCVDGPGQYQVVGIVDGESLPCTWTIEGHQLYGKTGPYDLVPAPRRIKRTVAVNVYGDGITCHVSHEKARSVKADHCLACIPITIDVPEGYGLDGADVKPLEVRA